MKIQTIQPAVEPKTAGRANRKETAVAGHSFKETLTESLHSTVATMSDLNAEIQKDPALKTTQADPSSMKEAPFQFENLSSAPSTPKWGLRLSTPIWPKLPQANES